MEIPDREDLNNQQHVYIHHQLKLEQHLQQHSSRALAASISCLWFINIKTTHNDNSTSTYVAS
jgi:hypothetical protein